MIPRLVALLALAGPLMAAPRLPKIGSYACYYGKGEIAALTCLGLVRNLATAKPELVFEARLTPTRAEVEARLAARDDRPEDDAWLWLNDEPAAIHAFLTRHATRVAPAGAACLAVYAQSGRRPG